MKCAGFCCSIIIQYYSILSSCKYCKARYGRKVNRMPDNNQDDNLSIRVAKKEEAGLIATIHKEEISQGFLSSLPLSFLTRLYEEIIQSGVCVVAEQQGRVIGFAAGTTNLSALFHSFFLHAFFPAVFILLPQIFSFRKVKGILEAFLYPSRNSDLPQAELLMIAVRREFQGRGIARSILEAFIVQMKKRGVKKFRVMVGKDLRVAVRLYESLGFRFVKEISVHSKEQSLIYVYYIQ